MYEKMNIVLLFNLNILHPLGGVFGEMMICGDGGKEKVVSSQSSDNIKIINGLNGF